MESLHITYLLLIFLMSIIFYFSLKKSLLTNKRLAREIFVLKQYKEATEESNIVSTADLKGNITYVNDKFSDCTLYSKEEVINQPHSLLKGEESKEIFKELWQTIQTKKTWHGVLKNKRKNGEFYFVNIIIKPILDENNEVLEYIAIRHEITDLIHKTEELEKMLKEDFLTKLGNRYKLLEDIKESSKPALALLDINNFSEINDFYGHEIGDEILQVVADNINLLVHKEYNTYRIYSDEFAVLSLNNEEKQIFIDKIKHICNFISSTPIRIKQKEIFIQLTYSMSFEEKNTIKKTANIIKKYVKTHKDVFVYDKSLEIEKIYEKNILWTLKLKKAFENNNIVPYYQPIYNVNTNRIEKYESLVRLINDDGIAISPYYFLDIAKKSKQYDRLTKIVINKTFEYFKDKDFEFSINLTIEDIKNSDITSLILKTLDGYDTSKVVFELVESEGIDNFAEINNFIDKVKELGCKIAIDDFGSGYSNFEYLIRLNADYIKIDGSLIKDILTNKNSEEIVSTIINFSKKQGFKTIAEFVSSKELFDKISELGIDYVQGYYIGEPKKTIPM